MESRTAPPIPRHRFLFFLATLCLALLVLSISGARAAGELQSAQRAIAAGDFERALGVLEPLIRTEPDNAEARFLRGVVFAQMGEADRAIAIFSNLTEQYPELSEPYNNLAVLYASKGALDKAREALIRATALQPDYHTAFENLGDVYTKLAAQAYQQAYHLQASNQRARRKHDVLAGLLTEPDARTAAREDPASAAGEVDAIPAQDAGINGDMKECLALGPMDAATRDRIAAWLDSQGVEFRPHSKEERQPRAYRVYLEGGANPGALRDELKAKGLTDIAVIGSGELAGRLSLGVFRQEESVRRRLGQLERLGYSARTLTLYNTTLQHWLVIMSERFDSPAFKRVFDHQAPRRVGCDWQPPGDG